MTTVLPNTPETEPSPGMSRRALIGTAAWSVPAIVAVTAVPAFAASGADTLSLTTPNMQVPAAGSTTVTALLNDANGQPLAGKAVAFTGPSGSSFSPATPTTDGSGVATTTLTTTDAWATPGSTLVLTASSEGTTGTAPLTVLGANAYGTGANGYGTTPVQLPLVFPSPIRSIATASSYSLALLQDGTVWGVGSNGSGQLGDGTTTDHSTWTKISALAGVVQIAVTGDPGNATSYALLSNGGLRAWGSNSTGQLGDGTTTSSNTPVTVLNISGATQIAAGALMAYALLANGEVRGWGRNIYGEIPTGTTSTPVTIAGITGATQIAAAGITAYALVSGQVYAWGYGRDGQIGDGAYTDSPPTLVSDLTNVTQISAGSNTGYAVTGGQVKAWGIGTSGELGDGTTGNTAIPVTVTGLTGTTRIAGLTTGAYAVASNGVYAWGANSGGQLGDGTTAGSSTPVAVTNIDQVTDLSSNSTNSYTGCFIRGRQQTLVVSTPNMQALAAGTATVSAVLKDADGQPLVGKAIAFSSPSGTTLSPTSPTTDSSGIVTTTLTTTDNWATPGSTLVLGATTQGATASAAVTVVGANAYGIGQGYGYTAQQLPLAFPAPIRSIATAYGYSLVLLQDGSVWGLGNNSVGQLGNGTTTDLANWTRIPSLSGVTQIAVTGDPSTPTSYALLSNGSVRAWGSNGSGQLGNGTTTDSSLPVAVSNVSGATQITAGSLFALALLADGQIRGWGRNIYGEIPTGTTSTPVTIAGVPSATQIAAGSLTAYAIAGSTSQVYAWGYGEDGQTGNGTNRSNAPAPVSGLTGVTQISASADSAYALTGGQVRAWGQGDSGQLGNGATTNSSTPVTVSGLTGVTSIAGGGTDSAYALTPSGAYAWGGNDAGQLGNGTNIASATPGIVQGTANVSAGSFNSTNSYTGCLIR